MVRILAIGEESCRVTETYVEHVQTRPPYLHERQSFCAIEMVRAEMSPERLEGLCCTEHCALGAQGFFVQRSVKWNLSLLGIRGSDYSLCIQHISRRHASYQAVVIPACRFPWVAIEGLLPSKAL